MSVRDNERILCLIRWSSPVAGQNDPLIHRFTAEEMGAPFDTILSHLVHSSFRLNVPSSYGSVQFMFMILAQRITGIIYSTLFSY
ncbi:hypothetical protein E2C01_090630 [Portunus trituberculatus]|uniref:Uncharacterized protein n=1 Tax=Portunus trituberculatus TaxID=210409 RepID=A0A5B7JF81_PORTR|nr:hypothetical protein [Portunus trituberculatus]